METNLLSPSYLTVEDLDRFLRSTALGGTGQVFLEAEANFGVNARFLVGLAAVESAFGASEPARSRHNLFGIAGGSWGSREAAIEGGAAYITRNFLRPTGVFYRGATLSGMNVFYAESSTWGTHVAQWANRVPASSAPEYAADLDHVWTSRGRPLLTARAGDSTEWVDAGELIHITATVRNHGWHPWAASGPAAAALSVRLFDPVSGIEVFPPGVPRALLGRRVYNHEAATVTWAIPAPLQGGPYIMRVDTLTGSDWMLSLTGNTQDRTLTVRPRYAHWQLDD